MDVVWFGTSAVLAISALIAAMKMAFLPDRWGPLVAVAIGVVMGLLAESAEVVDRVNYIEAGFQGAVAGLGAVGLLLTGSEARTAVARRRQRRRQRQRA